MVFLGWELDVNLLDASLASGGGVKKFIGPHLFGNGAEYSPNRASRSVDMSRIPHFLYGGGEMASDELRGQKKDSKGMYQCRIQRMGNSS